MVKELKKAGVPAYQDLRPSGPFVLWPTTYTTVERDLRGDTTYYRCVGAYSADVTASRSGCFIESTYRPQVTVVGDWRRSASQAFASFCEAFAEIIAIRTRQSFDGDGKARARTSPLCHFCEVKLDRSNQSPYYCDTCVECQNRGRPAVP